MTTTNTTNRGRAMRPGWALAAAAGALLALGTGITRADDTSVTRDINRDVTVTGSSQSASWSDGKATIAITVKDGQIESAKIDGASVDIPHRGVLRDGRRVTIDRRGDRVRAEVDGEQALSVNINVEQELHDHDADHGEAHEADDALNWIQNTEQPKVMIGVTLESAEDEELDLPKGVDAEFVTLITGVIDGLPASKAGLLEQDIVIEVEGSREAAPDQIRSMLNKKAPGEQLSLRVLRGGEQKELVLKLEAYDPEKLGQRTPRAWQFGNRGRGQGQQDMSDLRAEMARVSERLAKVAEQLNEARGDEARELSHKMAELGAEMAELGARSARDGARMRFFFDEEGGPGVPPVAPTPPVAPVAPDAQIPDEVRELLKRLGRDGGPIEIQPGDGEPGRAIVVRPRIEREVQRSDERMERMERRLESLERLLERLVEEKASDSKRDER